MYIMLYYIVFNSYLVTKNDEMFKEFEIKNEKKGITGMLVCYENEIIQVIEGEELDVHELFKKIKVDPRHKAVTSIKEGYITNRMFQAQPMRHEIIIKPLYNKKLSSIFNVMTELKKITMLFENFISNLTR